MLRAYQAVTEAERARTIAYLERLWAGLPDFFDGTMTRFVATVVPVMDGIQRQAAVTTDAYIARAAGASDGDGGPIGVPAELSSTEALRGVPAEDVWWRPATTVYRALGAGADLAAAGRQGLARAKSIAETDLQLARTHAGRHVMEQRHTVQGFRRVPRGGRSCALCLLAATQRYHKSALMPIHPGCHCTVLPIIGDIDPGHVIEKSQLDDVYASIAAYTGGKGRQLTREAYRTYVVEHEHGEIGPVLAPRGENWTSPSELKPKTAAGRP